MYRFPSAAASLALAAALFAIAIGARSGTELGRVTTAELVLTAVGAAMVCLSLLRAPSRPLYGGGALLLLAAFTGLTILSMAWSIAPDLSYVEVGRAIAHLAVFAGAVAAARLWPGSAPAVARGVLLAGAAIVGYGMAARIWPGAFDETALNGRIGLPYDYWNALGGTAALAAVPALWLGTRRGGGALGRALAYPALGLCIAAILITQSRGALAAAIVACLLWLAVVPLRLRSLAMLAVATIGAVPLSAWALSKDAFLEYDQPAAAREAVSGDFGLMVVATLVGLAIAGWVATVVAAKVQLSVRSRLRVGMAAGVATAVVALVVLVSVATSDQGIGGTVSDRFDELTSETTVPPVGGTRLGSVSSARSAYWRQAWDAFEERPWVGLGAGSFEIARLAYRSNSLSASRAHGFLAQTLSDLGVIGTAVALALLAAWLAATARSTGLGWRRGTPRPEWSDERAALVALALAVVAFGIQSLIDWTWFVPGLAVMALVAAGYVAGRGPLRPVGSAAEPGEHASRDATVAPSERMPRILAAIGVGLAAVLGCWAIWQPESSNRATAHSYELADQGRADEALEEAGSARDSNPYSNQPLYARASILAQLGRNDEALFDLRTAVIEHPRDPEALMQLASFELQTLNAPVRALRTAEAAVRLDPYSKFAADLRDRAAADAATLVEARRARRVTPLGP